ncbi:hypothetical protein HPB52_018620 [Rhipicephalus sanguineus]|uniref:Uncharacterized protein n=1 Tax=Rhipicephalus sanguineus TaxID=34632 RepID=A0A9D4PKE4_RHISA|nr:hypothetical protein HPB52_018620 [Rhipicephalus sanguineus]
MDDDEAESKKPRLEENKFDDKTSTYDFSDEEDMGEDEPFTLVTYKKKRAEGIPVVFRPTGEGCPQNKAAAQMRRHELIHGRQPRRNEASPNPAIVNPVRDHPPQRTPQPPHQRDASREPQKETRVEKPSAPTYASKLRHPAESNGPESSNVCTRVKLHVVLSDPQEKYQPIPTTPVHQ